VIPQPHFGSSTSTSDVREFRPRLAYSGRGQSNVANRRALQKRDHIVDLRSVLDDVHIRVESDADTSSSLGVTVPPFSRVVDVNEALDPAALLRTVSESIREEAELAANGCARTLLLAIYGADKTQFDDFLRSTGSVFAPSASAGYHLADVNDHAGILVVPAFDGRCKVAERVVVVTDTTPNGETRYLVKGYGGRIVQFREFQDIVAKLCSLLP